MSIYAGLDVSDKSTHVCVVDGEGAVLRREVLASDPDVIANLSYSPGCCVMA
jgi:transposase